MSHRRCPRAAIAPFRSPQPRRYANCVNFCSTRIVRTLNLALDPPLYEQTYREGPTRLAAAADPLNALVELI
jgi:hypothetical protein